MEECFLSSFINLFPEEVACVQRLVDDAAPVGLREEEALIANASASRKNEFRSGRWCAHEALKSLRIKQAPILKSEERAPIWPEGIVGSITHTKDYCAAAVARKKDIQSIGLDVELKDRLKPHLWRLTLTEQEQDFIRGENFQDPISVATLYFSIKEAFYKFQYPQTHTWLGFLDAQVVLDFSTNKFNIQVISSKSEKSFLDEIYSGGFEFFGNKYVMAGIYKKASN